ncbi:hypothetical protein EDB87DRAFT_1679703 [Lactarius vividus]|nr:hypothetical protein EDB87DRAFT_1679703 [Lactarius vividus]
MRTTVATAVAVLCFIAPSCAAASFQERAVAEPPAAPPSSLGKTAAGSLIGTAASLLASTAITGLFNEFSNSQNKSTSRREMLEVLEARANQELAARKYRRELVAALLDLRSLNELD